MPQSLNALIYSREGDGFKVINTGWHGLQALSEIESSLPAVLMSGTSVLRLILCSGVQLFESKS